MAAENSGTRAIKTLTINLAVKETSIERDKLFLIFYFYFIIPDHTCSPMPQEIPETVSALLQAYGLDLFPTNGVNLGQASFVNRCNQEPGAHLAVRSANDTHWHHGIMGVNATVIDMYGDTKESAVVSIRSLDDIMKDRTSFVIIQYPNDTPFHRIATLDVAHWYTQYRENIPGLYNLLSNNCESFATFCRTGRWDQMGNIEKILSHFQPAVKNICFKDKIITDYLSTLF